MKSEKKRNRSANRSENEFGHWFQFLNLVPRKQLMLSVIFGGLRIAISTAWPFLLYRILTGIGVISNNQIVVYLAFLVLLLAILSWFTHLQSTLNIRILKSFSLQLIDKIWKKMNALNWMTFHQKNRVYFFDLMMVETWRLRAGMAALLESLIINSLIALVLSLFIVFVDWSLFLVFLVGLIIMLSGHYFSSRQTRPLYKKFHHAWREQHLWVAKCVDQYDLIKMDRAYSESAKANLENSAAFLDKNSELLRVQAKWRNINQLLSNVVRIGVFLIGIYWVRIGYLSLEDLLLSLLVISIVQGNIMQIPAALSSLLEAQESIKTVTGFFSMKDDQSTVQKEVNEQVQIEKMKIQDLSYGYGDQNVLADLSLVLEVGKIYLWKGKNGSGKSTTANVLMGLIEPKKGKLFINDIETPWSDLKFYRNRFSFLNQDSPIFMGNIEENILFGHTDSKAALENMNSSWLSGLLPFSDQGLFRSVGERGEGLSGGEAKKIALIREMLRSSELLILDEPLNHLDEFTIEEIKREIVKIKRNSIVIIISHQTGFESIADEIIQF